MTEADQPTVSENAEINAPQPSRQRRKLQARLMHFASRSRSFHLILAALALAAMFGLALGFSLNSSPTFDEGMYIGRGWAFLRTGHLFPLGHPPLTNVLSGLGVLLEPDLPAPQSLDGWDENNPETFSEALLWRSGVNTNRVALLARLPIIFLSLLMASVIYRWGRELYGRWSAWLSLVLVAYCPNILAHSGLATTDLGIAAFFVGTLYAWTRFLHSGLRRWLLISGLLFGCAQASKFSALILIPILGVLTLVHVWRRGMIRIPLRRERVVIPRRDPQRASLPKRIASGIVALIVMGIIGLIALWASYLFQINPYPLASYVAEFRHFLGLAAEGHNAYLLGRFSENGWWYYHPFTLAAKLTLPSLVLLAIAVTLAVGRETHRGEWEVLFPMLVYLGFSMLGSLNVGVRYLLPMIPLIYLYIARIAYGPVRTGLVRPGALSFFVAAHVLISLWRFPYYISFFNLAVGGPDNGVNLLADSNVDWGQDLPSLAAYLRERGSPTVNLSYFGQSDPAYYGIDYNPLPGWPPPSPDPDFTPINPSPGLYAISASNLVGVQVQRPNASGIMVNDPDVFGYFRERQPIARVGHSIYIYEVTSPPDTENGSAPLWFAQCASPAPSESEQRLEALTGEDLTHFQFDCTQSLAFPAGSGWVLIQSGLQSLVDLGTPDYLARTESGQPRYTVWRIDAPPAAPESTVEFPPVPLPIPIAGHLDLLGYTLEGRQPFRAGTSFSLIAWWRVREVPPPPVSIFAHVLKPDNTPLAAGDALGIPAEQWQSGMIIVQRHTFNLPSDAPAGTYPIALGLYSLSTGERFIVSQSADRIVDSIVITTIEVTP